MGVCGKVDHLRVKLSSPWSTWPHPLILSLMKGFGKCFKNIFFGRCRLPLQFCLQSTAINLKFGRIHPRNLDISVVPRLKGHTKIPHFSLWAKTHTLSRKLPHLEIHQHGSLFMKTFVPFWSTDKSRAVGGLLCSGGTLYSTFPYRLIRFGRKLLARLVPRTGSLHFGHVVTLKK